MEKLIVKNSRWKYLTFAVLQILPALFFLSQSVGKTGKPQYIIAFLALLFISGSLFFAWRAFDSAPKIIIDNEGIWTNTFSVGKVFWEDIKEIKFTGEYLSVKLKDSDNPSNAKNVFNNRFIVGLRLKDTKLQTILYFVSRQVDKNLNLNFTK